MSNMAQKRAAKANRRKAIVAQKRQADSFEGSLGERVARAAGAPIRYCLIPDNLFAMGVGTVILVRGAAGESLSMAAFLVDAFCLGIKEAYFRSVSAEQVGILLDRIKSAAPMVPADPSYARKLLREAAAWAATLGFAPHRDFAAAERLFGNVDADASDATFTFGREGKPFYMSGPNDTPAMSRQRMAQLTKAVGAGNFDYISVVGALDGELDDDGDGDLETDDWELEEQTPGPAATSR
jgi:hypothetical protein